MPTPSPLLTSAVIKPMTAEVLHDIILFEQSAPHGWNRLMLEQEFQLRHGWKFSMHSENSQLLGYIFGQSVSDEAEIRKISILPKFRQRGLGARLLNFALKFLQSSGVRCCYLEFRNSNEAARRLYRQCGFEIYGQRKNYYTEPVEDAILMNKQIN